MGDAPECTLKREQRISNEVERGAFEALGGWRARRGRWRVRRRVWCADLEKQGVTLMFMFRLMFPAGELTDGGIGLMMRCGHHERGQGG